MIWEEEEASCSHIAAGLQVDILVAAEGNVKDPQYKVQFARSKVLYSRWQHPLAGLLRDNSTEATFDFPVQMRVRFMTQEQEQKDIVKNLPPLRSSLPENFFYPFLSSAPRLSSPMRLHFVAIVAVVLLVA
jgi:hypothetical protein